MEFFVDMVLCIDGTSSMESSSEQRQRLINIVKDNALRVYPDLCAVLEKRRRILKQFRVRVILFRDYAADGENAMLTTDFFLLPDQMAEFETCIMGIRAEGGGDIPEDGLEALAYAMKSDWIRQQARYRQIIVVFSDAPTHELGHNKASLYYPRGMASDLSELEKWWDQMDQRAKRLILYTPEENDWSYISENWENVFHIPVQSGGGLSDQNYEDTLGMIVSTI